MGRIRHHRLPWNWDGHKVMTLAVTTAFLEFAGALTIWLQLYDAEGNPNEIGLLDSFTGIIGILIFGAGSLGALGLVATGLIRIARSLYRMTILGIYNRPKPGATIPWIASIASMIFGTFLIVAISSRPQYFRDEILGLLATLLVAFAASSRTIEAVTERNEGTEEE